MKKIMMIVALCSAFPFTLATPRASFGQPGNQKSNAHDVLCPIEEAHSQGAAPSAYMRERDEKGMGFSQMATTHHFLLRSDGGVIQVEVKDAVDRTNRNTIRTHLKHIAQAFGEGDFAIPMFVHNTVPPGVTQMKRLRAKIGYDYEETPNGGRVVISSSDEEAIRAVHKFLIFQIDEHKTGDPITQR